MMVQAWRRVGRGVCALIVGLTLGNEAGVSSSWAGSGSTPEATVGTGADPAELEFRVAVGGVVFRKAWVAAPASTDSSDGLGPLYNARACSQCHPDGGRERPAPMLSTGEPAPGLVLRLSVPPKSTTERQMLSAFAAAAIGEPVYGLQLQTRAIPGLAREGRLVLEQEAIAVTLAGGENVHLARPRYRIVEHGYGPMQPDTMTSPRLAPSLIGLGLIEAIPDAAIAAGGSTGGGKSGGVGGRSGQARGPDGQKTLGRFGWKAAVASLRQQTGEALAIDMGLSNSIVPRPSGDCTSAQKDCLAAPNGESARHGGHEVGEELLALLTLYAANIPVPSRQGMAEPDAVAGENVFHAAGCAACHQPRFETGDVPGAPHLSRRSIHPYSDLLLHDMGEGLADGRPEGVATGREWRTAPLWGAAVGRQSFLHDGRALSRTEAILWHDGEAGAARERFRAMPPDMRRQLLAFLASL
jgi:CxxC motif-containing protein (DUF1111 family)